MSLRADDAPRHVERLCSRPPAMDGRRLRSPVESNAAACAFARRCTACNEWRGCLECGPSARIARGTYNGLFPTPPRFVLRNTSSPSRSDRQRARTCVCSETQAASKPPKTNPPRRAAEPPLTRRLGSSASRRPSRHLHHGVHPRSACKFLLARTCVDGARTIPAPDLQTLYILDHSLVRRRVRWQLARNVQLSGHAGAPAAR